MGVSRDHAPSTGGVRSRPILFSAPMVRALLVGSKTQTRRIVKFVQCAAPCNCDHPRWHSAVPNDWHCGTCGAGVRIGADCRGLVCPYGGPGDTLWVREAWQSDVAHAYTKPSLIPPGERFFFQADGGSMGTTELSVCGTGWRPSIHMPRWASRITLKITDVRVERLNEISAEDADAECFGGDFPENVLPELFPMREGGWGHLSLPECYARLWEHINGPGSWEANPWVWAVSFEVITPALGASPASGPAKAPDAP